MNKIAMVALFVIFLSSTTLLSSNAEPTVSGNITEYDWLVCGASLQESQSVYVENWTWDEMYSICLEIMLKGEILIERDDQRDIIIKMINLGDTVSIPLPSQVAN